MSQLKLRIEKNTAVIEEGEDSMAGKFITRAGKLTINTPFGRREIKTIETMDSYNLRKEKEAKTKKVEEAKIKKAEQVSKSSNKLIWKRGKRNT